MAGDFARHELENKVEYLRISGTEPRDIAYIWQEARPAQAQVASLVWLPGFKSDMVSTKATALAQWAQAQGRALLRFDYSGHGQSTGDFAKATISQWVEDTLAILDHVKLARMTLVGSSMGGWLALLVARELAQRGKADQIAAMVLIAPAVDFTQKLIWERLPPQVQQQIIDEGEWRRPSAYANEAMPITRQLFEDGRKHLLFGGEIRSYAPLHILQGMQDPDVPFSHALELVEHMAGDEVLLTLIKSGDHRLSTPHDIERLMATISAMPK
ncbi:MAG: alpha/beta fold hydrolase [Hyphomicrobiales bacterium]|nr:alpha/beta fold hydrolase [Hyphomicrobiales bacterium]MDE2115382.1 alpha/beta fold hydrolase [Hyphomicrobiales bacterium]